MLYPEKTPARTKSQWIIAGLMMAVGMILFVYGFYLETRNPRTNAEDDFAWWVLAVGTSLTAAGVVYPFARRWVVVLVALMAPFGAFFLMAVLYWSIVLLSVALADPAFEQKMVHSGYALIPQAAEMDALVGPARHEVSNFREGNGGEWISTTYFGGRYELTMHLQVEIDRRTGQVTTLIESPQFQLGEIAEVQGRGVSYGQWHQFGAADWEKVVRAGGGFSVIGITLDLDHPLPGFDRYQKLARSGIEMTGPQQ